MPSRKPAEPTETAWEACAEALTPRGANVKILGREWAPGEWQPISDDEKAILEANYNVLTVRKVNQDG